MQTRTILKHQTLSTMYPFCLTLSGQIWHLYRPFTSVVQHVSHYCAKPLKLHQVSFKVMSHFSVKRQRDNLDFETHFDTQGGVLPPSKRQKGNKELPKKRNTHFLCFPLVTNTSVPQLAESLKYFRQVATKPSKEKASLQHGENHCQLEQSFTSQTVQDAANTIDVNSQHPNTNSPQPLLHTNPDIQVLPASAYRPPGTFHLTLGVMDLSSEESMSQALELLQSLDYAKILQTVLSQQTEMQPVHPTGKDGNMSAQVEHSSSKDDASEKVLSLKRSVSSPQLTVEESHLTVFSKDNPLRISLTGLSTFPSPKVSRVFFAKPSSSPLSSFPLLKFSQAICRKFRNAGLITETRPLVLHATVANMRYAVQAKGGRKSKGKNWRFGKDRWADGQVDGRELIKCFNQYGGDLEEHKKGALQAEGQAHEFLWAKDIELNRVAICKMGAEKSKDEVLGQVYPPVGEKFIFS